MISIPTQQEFTQAENWLLEALKWVTIVAGVIAAMILLEWVTRKRVRWHCSTCGYENHQDFDRFDVYTCDGCHHDIETSALSSKLRFEVAERKARAVWFKERA